MNSGNSQHGGVPAWVGPLLIGVAVVGAGSFLGAAGGVNSQMTQHAIKMAEIKTAFDAFCERILQELSRNASIDERQDREIQQIRSHLRLPPN
jgi:hypothetical protein